MKSESKPVYHWWLRYVLLLAGLFFLLLSHISILMGDLWLIPAFLRIY